MREVEAAVRALGKAIQADSRYLAYLEAKTANDNDKELQEQIQEFNLKRMSWQRMSERNEKQQDQEKIEKLEAETQAIYMAVLENPHMQAFQAATQEMDAMLQEINTIINLCAHGEDPETCHPDLSNCSGNCASCSGCHERCGDE